MRRAIARLFLPMALQKARIIHLSPEHFSDHLATATYPEYGHPFLAGMEQ